MSARVTLVMRMWSDHSQSGVGESNSQLNSCECDVAQVMCLPLPPLAPEAVGDTSALAVPAPAALEEGRGLPVTVTFECRWKMLSYSLPRPLLRPLASSSDPPSLRRQ
jgi:hypothetical protein